MQHSLFETDSIHSPNQTNQSNAVHIVLFWFRSLNIANFSYGMGSHNATE